jgi:lipoprotein-anchoring transpeptidase ErfK/SrfK
MVRMRRGLPLLVLVVLAAGCGSTRESAPTTTRAGSVQGTTVTRCRAGTLAPAGSAKVAFAAVVRERAVAYRAPGGEQIATFGKRNVNRYPTVLGVLGRVIDAECTIAWYRVQLPVKPNGIVGFVRAADVDVAPVATRIVVDVSDRRLTLYRSGKPELTATVAVGSPATPTPTGRYYVNQRLVPDDVNGPFGPGAVGISAFSNVLTGWTQGGPIAIHGTNAPWSIGRAVSNGCIRLPNETLRRVFREAVAGTPVIINA